jgi:hypothetical protein
MILGSKTGVRTNCFGLFRLTLFRWKGKLIVSLYTLTRSNSIQMIRVAWQSAALSYTREFFLRFSRMVRTSGVWRPLFWFGTHCWMQVACHSPVYFVSFVIIVIWKRGILCLFWMMVFFLVARRPRMVLVGNAWILCCPPICWDLLSRAMKWMPLAVGRTTNQVYNMLGPGWWRSEAEWLASKPRSYPNKAPLVVEAPGPAWISVARAQPHIVHGVPTRHTWRFLLPAWLVVPCVGSWMW